LAGISESVCDQSSPPTLGYWAGGGSSLGKAGCNRVIIGGSFVTDKECPNDFDGCYEDFCLDPDTLDPLFVENVDQQQTVFGGRLFDIPSYEGFFQTDRAGRPKGVIALDPQDLFQ
jgi:hypothetical protein